MFFQTIFDQVSNITTIFLGIFIEAAPFLLLGTVASGLVEVFISQDELTRIIPKNVFLATLIGGLMGFTFPVCECGVVPLTRRLLGKGLPTSAGMAFLLAAPIVNPIVLASTYAAFGWGRVLLGRFALGLLVAVVVGLIFALNKQPEQMIRQLTLPRIKREPRNELAIKPVLLPVRSRLQSALRIAGDEFFEMGRYLVIGALLASLVQTLIPQGLLRTLGAMPVASVFVMLLLAFVLCVCSTVDAFIALTFVNTFTTGSILGFLIFGPMVDIKSTLMFARVFHTKVVVYLIVLPFLVTALLAVFINLNLSW
jgi:hypothetical protein